MTTSFEQVRHGLGADVTRRQIIASACKEGAKEAAAEVRARWQKVFAAIPAERQRMATLLLSDARCQMTDEEIIATCCVGTSYESASAVSDSPLAILSEDSLTSRQESELPALAVSETSRLLGKPIPATLPELPRPIPRVGRGYQIDPALQIAAEALAKRLAPITCQS